VNALDLRLLILLMKDDILIRDYKTTDKSTVLELLRLNTPEYFSPEEENFFIHYLDNELEYYYILEVNKRTVGCGGFNFPENATSARISWDILHPDFHRRSLGSVLLNYRIEKLKHFPELRQIIVRTSQLVYKFYEKQGFKLTEVVENYWAKGFHLYQMEYINH